MEHKIPAFQDPSLLQRSRVAMQFLENEALHVQEELKQQRQIVTSELEKSTLDFMQAVGALLSKPLYNLLLQQFSEGAGLAPPMLNDFELKLQLILFKQLKAFFNDFALEFSEDDQRNMAMLLQRMDHALVLETEILSTDTYETLETRDPDTQLPNEIEGYYNSRYFTQSGKAVA